MNRSKTEKFHNKTSAELIATYLHLDDYVCDYSKSEIEQIDDLCNSQGIFKYEFPLDKGWWKVSTNVMVVQRKADHKLVVLNPDMYNRFRYYDAETDKYKPVTEKEAKEWGDVSLIFSPPYPIGKITTKEILKFCLSTWKFIDFAVIIGLALISVCFGLLLPKLNYAIFANAVPGGSVSFLIGLTLFIVAANFGKMFNSTLFSFLTSYLSNRTDALASSTLMIRILSLPMSAFNKFSSGELVEMIERTNGICTSATSVVFVYGISCLFSLSYFAEISSYNNGLVMPAVVAVFIEAITSLLIVRKAGQHEERVMRSAIEERSLTLSLITGIQKIKLAGAEKKAYELWEKCCINGLDLQSNPPLIVKFSATISLLLSSLVSVTIYYIVGKGGMQVAEFFAFQTAFGLVYSAVGSLKNLVTTVASLKPSMALLDPLLAVEPETNPNSEVVHSLDGTIKMEHVYFRYSEKTPYYLNDFSLDIKKGEYVAIVGKTGCGKSTLIKVLLGFETPESGHIYYNGKDLNTLEKRSVRKHIGTVLQNAQLFSGSIFENLRLCAPSLTEEEAWEVADLVDMKKDIMAMPMKMHTLLSEGGGGVSGGQMQRLAVGRAIAQRPEILILDEATSALDNLSQNKIIRALDEFHCTRLVIAHRLSTIKNCDRIVMLENGKIIEDGTYEELIALDGSFAELVRRQRLDVDEIPNDLE